MATLCFSFAANAQTLSIGSLVHDGPPTPEQLSLVIPITGTVSGSTTATVRYRQSGTTAWQTGHPMYMVQPGESFSPSVGQVRDEFAWPILDLSPGTTYDVEVTVSDGSASVVRSGTFTTRLLPPAAGAPNKIISAGSTAAEIQNVFNDMEPGDVVQFENGTYNVDELTINRSGTESRPIYIRGESRNGVILRDGDFYILRLRNANHVVIENMTLRGSGTDGGVSSPHTGIRGGGNNDGTVRNTIRNMSILGVDRGINFYDMIQEALIYNNVIQGNNPWNSSFLGDNRTWDDDGVNIPGYGNVAFNNTVSGFGDTFSFAQHVGGDTLTETRGVHFYRNDIRNSLDDLVEVDHGHANITFYDNRSHNSATCSSLDPLYGGPFVYVRNICINPARVNMHKWNSANSGQFLYNNTFISTVTATGYDPDVAAWYQPNNGPQNYYGFRNNIVVYHGRGILLWLESSGHDFVDWTHNSWFPDRAIEWENFFSSLSGARNGLGDTTPVFSGSNRRMLEDNLTTSNPWTTQISLGSNSLTEVTASYSPVLQGSSSPKNSGAVIANITDGFSGQAPDRGAIIDGRPAVIWGASGSAGTPSGPRPSPPLDLLAN